MTKLRDIERAMRPQFIFDRSALKPLQLNQDQEGTKDLARMIFVGVADMYGFKSGDITNFLDMGYDSYRNKLSEFKASFKEAQRRVNRGYINLEEDNIKKFYYKTSLVLNYIKLNYNTEPYLKLEKYITHE
jgi:hypothetical protein